jgi:hypothetical protein
MKRETFTVAIVVATVCVLPLMLYKASTHRAADPVALSSDVDAMDDVPFDPETNSRQYPSLSDASPSLANVVSAHPFRCCLM